MLSARLSFRTPRCAPLLTPLESIPAPLPRSTLLAPLESTLSHPLVSGELSPLAATLTKNRGVPLWSYLSPSYPLRPQHRRNRLCQYLHIQPQAPVFDIFQVQF